MTNSLIRRGALLLVVAAVTCVGTNVALIALAPLIQIRVPEVIGLLLYLTGLLPLIPGALGLVGGLMFLAGTVQEWWTRPR